jgi:RHS repeat-associated protein
VIQQIYSYDSQGSVKFIQAYSSNGFPQGNACLQHDALERLVKVGSLSSGYGSAGYCDTEAYYQSVTARFKYDSRNRRAARWVASANTWVYTISDASGQPLSELGLVNGNWIPLRDYVWLDGKPLVQIEYPGPAGSPQGYAYYIHTDALGAPRILTNQSAQVVWAAAMRPYGDLVEATAPDSLSGRTVVTNLRLPGQYDERVLNSIGLQGPYYNWNRWYLPGVGRYLELDPAVLVGMFNTEYGADWYGYALQNPLVWADPFGLESFSSCWMKCIEGHSFSNNLTFLPFSAYPKWMLGFRTPVSTQPLTTLPSGIQFWLARWGVYSGDALRAFGRRVSPVGTALTIGEGFWDIGVIGTCAASCGTDDDNGPKTCH